jgi:hypothetical protein
MFIYSAARLGIELLQSQPQLAEDLYRRAKDKLNAKIGKEEIRNYEELAALAEKLQNGESGPLLADALKAMESVESPIPGFGAMVAEIAATGSPTLANKVISTLPDKEKPQARARAIQMIAHYDTPAALNELAKLENSSDETGQSYARAVRYVIQAIGSSDPAKALALARGIQAKSDGVMALALAATFQKKDLAVKVLREAADAASAGYNVSGNLLKIAAMAYEIDPKLGEQLFAEAREKLKTEKGSNTDFAFYYRLIDPAESRLMLEIEYANLKRTVGLVNPGWSFVSPALAMAAIDVDRALEMTQTIPETETNAGFDARRKIAQYVLAPDAVRRTLPFERWNASDTWIPGQPTGW